MSFQVHKMFEIVKAHVTKSRDTNILETELKNQLFQRAMQEAKAVRCHCGQIRYMQTVDLLQQFVQGLYYPLNFPVVDIDFFSRSLGVNSGEEIAERFQKALDILAVSHHYTPFSHQSVYLLGMAKAARIEKKGESLLFVASFYKIYYQAFAQVMETYCDCK